jgi:hypothetical protein
MSSVVQQGLDSKSRKLDMQIALKSRIANRHAKVGIIGQGYVGLPLAQVFVRAGYKMLGLKPPLALLSSHSVESALLSSPVTPSQPSPGPAVGAGEMLGGAGGWTAGGHGIGWRMQPVEKAI